MRVQAFVFLHLNLLRKASLNIGKSRGVFLWTHSFSWLLNKLFPNTTMLVLWLASITSNSHSKMETRIVMSQEKPTYHCCGICYSGDQRVKKPQKCYFHDLRLWKPAWTKEHNVFKRRLGFLRLGVIVSLGNFSDAHSSTQLINGIILSIAFVLYKVASPV